MCACVRACVCVCVCTCVCVHVCEGYTHIQTYVHALRNYVKCPVCLIAVKWLNPMKTLREQGVRESQVLVLRWAETNF